MTEMTDEDSTVTMATNESAGWPPGDARNGGPLKILYASGLSPNDSSLYRLWALERLGHKVVPLNAYHYRPRNALLEKITYRVAMGPWVDRLNRDLLEIAGREKPDLVWAFTPTNGHVDVVRYCAPKGIHVIMEKPLAATLNEALEIQALARKHNILVLTNYGSSWQASAISEQRCR